MSGPEKARDFSLPDRSREFAMRPNREGDEPDEI
jgi:hypothetical protein